MFKIEVPEIDSEIARLEKEYEENQKKYIEPILQEMRNLQDKRIQYIVENKLYHTFPLDEEYIKKKISHVYFVTADGEIDKIYCDDMFWVDEDGYPEYSSCLNGNIQYDKEKGCFVHWYHWCPTNLDYIGFTEIEFRDDCEEEDEE